MLASLAQHYGFDVETPFEALPPRAQEVVLNGSGEEKIAFRYPARRAAAPVKEHAFEGIVPNLERRHRETDSVAVKEELTKYLNTRDCPDCHGTRLRAERAT
jgi:excinuclease ABC subunit A